MSGRAGRGGASMALPADEATGTTGTAGACPRPAGAASFAAAAAGPRADDDGRALTAACGSAWRGPPAGAAARGCIGRFVAINGTVTRGEVCTAARAGAAGGATSASAKRAVAAASRRSLEDGSAGLGDSPARLAGGVDELSGIASMA